jgi:thioredoxin-related protein
MTERRVRSGAPWRWAAALILLGSLFVWISPPPSAKTNEGVGWYSYDEGTKKARESDKPILLDFYTDWCGWCKKMDKETYGSRDVQQFLNLRFIPIKINAESKEVIHVDGKEMKMRDLTRKYGVRGYPTTVFLESDGNLIGPLPGYTDPDSMRKVLAYIQEKAYKKMSLEEFTKHRSESRATGR